MLRKGWLRGDVTGDGLADRVAVVEDPRAAFRCRFAIAVYTRGRVLLRPLGRFIDKPSEAIGQPWPLVRLLASIDRRRGAEILLAMSHGASFEQSWLMTVRNGQLRRLSLPGSYAGQLEYGSVAAFGTSFDCGRAHSGVFLQASYSMINSRGNRWRYVVTRYRVERTRVEVVAARSTTVRGPYSARPRWWRPYYNEGDPFRRCTIAHQPRPS
jgi:hypothetical protein